MAGLHLTYQYSSSKSNNMKQLQILLTISLVFSMASNGQDSLPKTRYVYMPEKVKDHDYYYNKSKALIPTGYVLFGIGVGATIGGAVGATDHYNIFSGEGGGYLVLFVAGVGCLASSIPVLITGYHYKHRAKILMHQDHAANYYHIPVNANVYSVGIGLSIR